MFTIINEPMLYTDYEILAYQVPKEWRNEPHIYSLLPAIPKYTKNIDFDIFDFDMIYRDEPTKDLLRKGKTIGCFYIESPGMRSLLRRLSVETFEMLTAASSIIRPGVAESGMMQEFLLRHKNPGRRFYLTKEMEELLGETYGVMIYQEDVMKVVNRVAGLSHEEADILRRAMSGKSRSSEAMKRITERFFESCYKKGLKEKLVRQLWHQIESFAGYSFCKAHSASFAQLSFQVAYLKANYPAEFMSSVLNNGGGFYSPGVYIQECKRMGLQILLPCINGSEYEYTGKGSFIRIGLIAIKNVSLNSKEKILYERKKNGKYVSLADFLVRTKTGMEESVLLVKCGTMDCFNQTRPTLLRLLDIYINRRKILDDNYNDLFMHEAFIMEEEAVTKCQFRLEEICRSEYEFFDYMVTRHPLYFFKEYINAGQIVAAEKMFLYKGEKIKMAGWFMSSKRIRTKKGDIMKFLSLEDLTGTFEAVIFPNAYQKYASKTISMGPYIINGKVDTEDDHNLIVAELEVLTNLIVNSKDYKESADKKYYGEREEEVNEKDLDRLADLQKEKIKRAVAA